MAFISEKELISSLYVCMVNIKSEYNFVETPRKLLISTDEDPSLRIESSAMINLRGVPQNREKYAGARKYQI